MKLSPHIATRLLMGGLVLIVASVLANFLLGGTGGAIWIALVVIGVTACVVALVYFIMNPMRRRS